MKRKQEQIEMTGYKVQRMSDTVVIEENIRNDPIVPEVSRNFSFKLTDATAKKNLLTGARRIPFDKEPKQKSVKLMFSAGAYIEVVMPTLLNWKNCVGNCINFGGISINIFEVKAGYELNSKHFDTKIVFLFDKNRVVIHSYNSTQNMKVEGKGYLEFIQRYLEPYFLQRIQDNDARITEYNMKIVGNLTKPVVRRSTQYKPASQFICKKCDHTLETLAN